MVYYIEYIYPLGKKSQGKFQNFKIVKRQDINHLNSSGYWATSYAAGVNYQKEYNIEKFWVDLDIYLKDSRTDKNDTSINYIILEIKKINRENQIIKILI